MSREIIIKCFSISQKCDMEDIEINSEDIFYVCNKLKNGVIMHGIQTNKKNSDKALKICDKIADLIYKLRSELNE